MEKNLKFKESIRFIYFLFDDINELLKTDHLSPLDPKFEVEVKIKEFINQSNPVPLGLVVTVVIVYIPELVAFDNTLTFWTGYYRQIRG